jgi:excisionase family DNA binding protein
METNVTTTTRETLTVEEAGRVLGIGRASAYDAVKRGELPVIRLGKRIVVPRAALDRLLASAGPTAPDSAA